MLGKDHYFHIWEMAEEKELSEDQKKLAKSAFCYAWNVYQRNHRITASNVQSEFTNNVTNEKVRIVAVFYDEQCSTNKVLVSSITNGTLYAITTSNFDEKFTPDIQENLSCINCGYKLSGCRCNR